MKLPGGNAACGEEMGARHLNALAQNLTELGSLSFTAMLWCGSYSPPGRLAVGTKDPLRASPFTPSYSQTLKSSDSVFKVRHPPSNSALLIDSQDRPNPIAVGAVPWRPAFFPQPPIEILNLDRVFGSNVHHAHPDLLLWPSIEIIYRHLSTSRRWRSHFLN